MTITPTNLNTHYAQGIAGSAGAFLIKTNNVIDGLDGFTLDLDVTQLSGQQRYGVRIINQGHGDISQLSAHLGTYGLSLYAYDGTTLN